MIPSTQGAAADAEGLNYGEILGQRWVKNDVVWSWNVCVYRNVGAQSTDQDLERELEQGVSQFSQ